MTLFFCFLLTWQTPLDWSAGSEWRTDHRRPPPPAAWFSSPRTSYSVPAPRSGPASCSLAQQLASDNPCHDRFVSVAAELIH